LLVFFRTIKILSDPNGEKLIWEKKKKQHHSLMSVGD